MMQYRLTTELFVWPLHSQL